MVLLDRLRSLLAGTAAPALEGHNYWVYVRCSHCGETLLGRIDLRNDLSLRDDAAGYLVRKTLMGGKRCFQPIEVILYFDANRQMLDREIQGGEFIEAAEYEP